MRFVCTEEGSPALPRKMAMIFCLWSFKKPWMPFVTNGSPVASDASKKETRRV